MNVKPTRINPLNVSPSARMRQPLRDIINLSKKQFHIDRFPTPKQNVSQRKLSQINSYFHVQRPTKPEPSEPSTRQTHLNINQKRRGERTSLKPSQKTKTSHIDQYICSNHNDKYAKFKVVSDDIDLFYCEKCAILLASQGFKVQKLQGLSLTPSNDNSRAKISNFFSSNKSQAHLGSNKCINESFGIVQEINNFLQHCEQTKQHNKDERHKIQNYYSSIIRKIDEFQEELKTSISIMMAQQKQQMKGFFDELDKRFILRVNEIQSIQNQLSSIVRDLTENLHTIAGLSQEQFKPMINCYSLTLNEATKRVSNYSNPQAQRIQILNPKADSLKHLAEIISECRYKLKTHKKTQSSGTILNRNQKLDNQKPPSTMFFSFNKSTLRQSKENIQSKIQKLSEYHLSELDANVNVIMTNSDQSSGDQKSQLQQSIADPTFNRLIVNKLF